MRELVRSVVERFSVEADGIVVFLKREETVTVLLGNDPAARDDRNRKLRKADEEFVFQVERRRLAQSGSERTWKKWTG